MNNLPVGIFDSGIGGVSVLNECVRFLPFENFIYLADYKNAPYGNKSADEIIKLSLNCCDTLLKYDCKAIIAACNTATSVAIEIMRKKYAVPVIGIEPALKPLKNSCETVLLLCTLATATQEKFLNLKEKYGCKKLIIAPQQTLAMLIENNIHNLNAIRGEVEAILAPYKNVRKVVLGCTHYSFIKDMIIDILKSDAVVYDGAEGTAKQLFTVLDAKKMLAGLSGTGEVKFI